MKLVKSIACMISVAALPIGAAFAGEDSTQRFHSTGPEWHEVTTARSYRDSDSDPANAANVAGSSAYPLERYDYPA